MQKNKITLIIGASLLLGITACQPPSDKTDRSDATSTSSQTENSSSTQPLAEAKTPKALTKALVALSEKTLKEQLICSKLEDTINAIDNKSEIEDIHAVQHQLTACLPVATNAEALQWLEEYQAMYERFLSVDSAIDNSGFYALMRTMEEDQKITVAQLKEVSPRVRYLVSLIRSNSDVRVRYLGESDYEFHHDLMAMADVFTPYLPDDQSEFIQRMAQDNQALFWFDDAIAISFEELVKRAVFWEDFMNRYPQSSFYDDAKALLGMYRYILFSGSENIQWIDDDIRKFYLLRDERLMRQLAERTDSQLAQDVQKLSIFMEQSDSERLKRYPIPNKDDNGHEIDERNSAQYQLHKALDLSSPWTAIQDRNCLTGIICVDENAQ